MSIVAADLIFLGAANHAVDDASTQGGAISTVTKVEFTDIAATDNIEVLSDGADTRTITLFGRNAAGVIITEGIVLNGTTPVTSTLVYERFSKATITSDASRTATIRRATGDTLIGTLGLLFTKLIRFFYDSASGAAQTIRYEKLFAKNTNGTLTLTTATIKLTADPAAVIRIGGAPSVDDSATVTNRLTAPSSVTFVDDNVSQAVPGNALAAGSAIGIWVEMTLAANNAAIKNSLTVQISGNTV